MEACRAEVSGFRLDFGKIGIVKMTGLHELHKSDHMSELVVA